MRSRYSNIRIIKSLRIFEYSNIRYSNGGRNKNILDPQNHLWGFTFLQKNSAYTVCHPLMAKHGLVHSLLLE